MAKPTRQGAVIYTRVSSKDQIDGYSLDMQARTCQEYACRLGYEALRIFEERGESAKTADRTELQAMRKYVADNASLLKAVIVYKVDRLARNALDHGLLRAYFTKYGVRLLSATENLDDTSTGKFAETVLAACAELDNSVRADRAKSGMKDAVRAGRYVWPAPIGYRNNNGGLPSIIPDSPATVELVRKAWTLVASGTPAYEARDQLVKEGLRNHGGGVPSAHAFRAMLTCETYVGYINAFGMRVQGDFEPLVDAELFRTVERILNPPKGSPSRSYKRANPDFPLRGTILCPHCGAPLTASWSRGHGGKYGYYRCMRCNRVAFRKEGLEPNFVSHLNRLSLTPSLIGVLSKAIEANLGENARSNEQVIHQLRNQLEGQRERKSQIVEKSLTNVLDDDLVRNLLKEADQKIEETEAALRHCTESQGTDLKIVKVGLLLLDKIGSMWEGADVMIQKRLQRFVFPDGATFDGLAFGTTSLPACLQLEEADFSRRGRLVRPTGFEPVVYGSGGHHLIQLGHGRTLSAV
jgi:site-specific DNA recombinase